MLAGARSSLWRCGFSSQAPGKRACAQLYLMSSRSAARWRPSISWPTWKVSKWCARGTSSTRRGPDRRRQGRGGARRSASRRCVTTSAGPPNAGVSARRALGGNGPMHWRAYFPDAPLMAVRAALGGAVRRREDPRLVTGAGQYTDDVRRDGCLHAVFVRSTFAHARITNFDAAAATSVPGVLGVFRADDLGLEPLDALGALRRSEPARFVGDAIAVVVAETRSQAVDAAASVVVDYEPLPVVVDPEAALEPGATVIHPDRGDNLAFAGELGDEGALEGAEVIIRGRFLNQRLAGVPIEANTVLAEPDGEGGIRMWVSTQVPFSVRMDVASAIGLPEAKVRVIAPDVGGGFGAKLMTYPEQSVLGALALKLGRAVRWFEFRSENMVAMTHGRGQIQDVALGATRDGKLVGLEVAVIGDAGAYPGLGAILSFTTGQMSSGVYDIPKIRFSTRVAITNTTVVSAYRGAGRPEAASMIVRAMDMLAAELAIDPAELRRRNLITGPFPHTTATEVTYDSGDYRHLQCAAIVARVIRDLGGGRVRKW